MMHAAVDHTSAAPRAASPSSTRTGLLAVAGLTSLGAGAIHAAAVGVHAESRSAALAFTAVAALQLGWGGLALLRSSRLVALVGVLIGTGAVAGWAVAKSTGISFIVGMDVAEPVQTADALAAGLAAATVVLVALSLTATRADRGFAARRWPLPILSVGVIAVGALGMSSAGTHVHGRGTSAAGAAHEEAAGDGDGDDHGDDHGAETASAETASTDDAEHADYEPVPYDPTQPIDLGGVDGVTPEQQAAAENLVAVTLHGLPQWSDTAVAEAAGFRSIGDGGTGVEHFVNREFMEDDVILDPDKPESLVYDTTGGGQRLVAAMYMVGIGTPLEDVPDIGGALMQWHTHENLCFNAEGRVAGLTDAEGNCPAGLVKPEPTPMIHVWIEPHECGPFAALEGIGGGRIPDGEVKLCDHAHGA